METKSMRTPSLSLFLLLAAIAALPASAQLTPTAAPPLAKGWKSVVVAEGIAQPWGMAWTADGKLLVTSKEGSLYVLNGTKFDKVALEGMPPVYTGGQAGLLDISVHPADKANPRIYMTLATGDDKANRTTGEPDDTGAGCVRR
jgi:aldose sugar dehydrogenase